MEKFQWRRVAVAALTPLALAFTIAASAESVAAQTTTIPTKFGIADVTPLPDGTVEWKWRGGSTAKLICETTTTKFTCPDGSTHTITIKACRGIAQGQQTAPNIFGYFGTIFLVFVTGCPSTIVFFPIVSETCFFVERDDDDDDDDDTTKVGGAHSGPFYDVPGAPTDNPPFSALPTGFAFGGGRAYADTPGVADFKDVSGDDDDDAPFGGKAGDRVTFKGTYQISFRCPCPPLPPTPGQPTLPPRGPSTTTKFSSTVTLKVGTSPGSPAAGPSTPGATTGTTTGSPAPGTKPQTTTPEDRKRIEKAGENLPRTGTSTKKEQEDRWRKGEEFKKDLPPPDADDDDGDDGDDD